MCCIDIILLDKMPGNPHFSFDRSVPLPILYLLTKKKQILNVGSLQNFDHVAIPCLQKGVLDAF